MATIRSIYVYGGVLIATAVLTLAPTVSTAADTAGDGQIMKDRLADYWVGFFSNERQVRLNGDRLMPNYPEMVLLNRDMRVHRLNNSPLGSTALFLEEVKGDSPDLAHRQRVMTFEWMPETQEVRVHQHFFKEGPTYDRTLLDPEKVAAMDASQFMRVASCDLYMAWDEEFQRFKGGMRPRACEYDHAVSGPVYAEFDMILDDDRVMYRDRSIKRPDGAVRGEIDGFSWLVFDRMSKAPVLANGDRISRDELMRRMPASGSMEGTWVGEFVRVDANGEIIERFPSHIIATYLPDGHEYDFHQVNTYRAGTDEEVRIESYGKWDIDRLHFFNDRLEGWSKDLSMDASGLTSAFTMTFKDGSGLVVSEIISRSPVDSNKRMRATQYMKDGEMIRRTLIEETRIQE